MLEWNIKITSALNRYDNKRMLNQVETCYNWYKKQNKTKQNKTKQKNKKIKKQKQQQQQQKNRQVIYSALCLPNFIIQAATVHLTRYSLTTMAQERPYQF